MLFGEGWNEGEEEGERCRAGGCAADVGSWIVIFGAERDGGKRRRRGVAGDDGCQGRDADRAKVMVKRRRELGGPCVRVPWLEACRSTDTLGCSINILWYLL